MFEVNSTTFDCRHHELVDRLLMKFPFLHWQCTFSHLCRFFHSSITYKAFTRFYYTSITVCVCVSYKKQNRNCLPFAITWFSGGVRVAHILVFCAMYLVLFVVVLCIVPSVASAYMDYPFLIASSVFSNIYVLVRPKDGNYWKYVFSYETRCSTWHKTC